MHPKMERAKTTGEVVNAQAESDERLQFETVVRRAIEVFANQETALRWLGTPVRALEYATPISLLGQPDGRRDVLKVLDKIEFGVL